MQQPFWQRLLLVTGIAAAAAMPIAARADDRPFLATSSAAAEEDDERVWSLQTWALRDRAQHGLTVAAEYAFVPTLSVQFSAASARDRLAGESAQQVDGEVKWLFNRIARDGWGAGLNLSLGASRSTGSNWRAGDWAASALYSLELAHGSFLHLNAGLQRDRGERRVTTASLAAETQPWKTVTLFAEAARQGSGRLLHGGVRWWLKRERVAIDIASYHRRDDDTRATGIVLGFNLYDL